MTDLLDAKTTEKSPPARLGYQPALDGVRGLAIVLVVAFHYLGALGAK